MIEAIQGLGQHVADQENLNLDRFEDLVKLLTENPASNETYKKVLSIQIKKDGQNYKYAGIEINEYDSGKTPRYLYRRGAPNGCDHTPTARITEAKKTFNVKILNWFKQDFSKFQLDTKELEFLKKVREAIENNKEIIEEQLTEAYNKVKKDKLNAIVTVELLDRGSKKLPGDIDAIKKILVESALEKYYNKHNKTSKAKGNICSVCRNSSEEVYGFVSTYAFYTVDKPGMVAGGFDQSKAWKNYPVCKRCALLLELGKDFLNKYSKFNFYGFDYLLLPKPIGEHDEETLNEIYDIMEFQHEDAAKVSITRRYQKLLENTKKEIFGLLAEKPNSIQFNMMIYKESKREFKILKYVEGIYPSDLRRLFKAKSKVDADKYIKETMVDVFEKRKKTGEVPLQFDFGSIWYVMKDQDENHGKYFLEVLGQVFKGRQINYPFYMNRVVHRIRKAFVNNYDFEEAVMRGFCSLLFLDELGLLNRGTGESMSESVRELLSSDEIPNRVEVARKIFENYPRFFKGDAEKATFLMGVLSQLLMDIQLRERGSTPFRAKLQGLKLDERKVKNLLSEIMNKLEEYESNYYRDLETYVSELLIQAQDAWNLSKDEISFYFALGMNLSKYFKTKMVEENE